MAKQKNGEISLRTIWGLARSQELHMTGEELHLLVLVQTGKESLKELTQGERKRVAYVLMKQKDSARAGKRQAASGYSVTDNQKRKVYKLMEALGWDERRVNGMCRRMFRIDEARWLDYQQMSNLIEALKAMLERKEASG